MLKEDKKEGLERLNKIFDEYKSGTSIQEYMCLATRYLFALGRPEKYNLSEALDDLEKYSTDIFLERMKQTKDGDKEEQMQYYKENLKSEKAKSRVDNFVKQSGESFEIE